MLAVDYVYIYNFLCDKYRDSIRPSRETEEMVLQSFYDNIGRDLYMDKNDSLRFTSQSSFLDEVEFSGEIVSKEIKYYFSIVEYDDKKKWQDVSWERI
jgi:hypothetical protein